MPTKKEPIPIEMTWQQFEDAVKNILRAKGEGLTNLTITRGETVHTNDVEFTMDVVAKFTAFGGAEFTVLIECKHHKNPIEIGLVRILHSKLSSAGAQKAMMVTTTKFQRGAIEFAKAHGISLIQLQRSSLKYAVKSILVDAVEYDIDEDGNNTYEILCQGNALDPDIPDIFEDL